MSSNHHAVFASAAKSRHAFAPGYAHVLTSHEITFSGSARGMNYEPEWDDFEPMPGKEMEKLRDWSEAIKGSVDWPCVSIDSRMRFWDVEFYLFDVGPEHNAHGCALYCPDSWYQALVADDSVRQNWMHLALALLKVGGHDGFICGNAVQLKPMSIIDIRNTLEQITKTHYRHPSELHCAALRQGLISQPLRNRLQDNGFNLIPQTCGFEWITREQHQ